MIDYTEVTEDGFTRACFTEEGNYYEIQISGVPEADIQEFLAQEVQSIKISLMSIEEIEAMHDAES